MEPKNLINVDIEQSDLHVGLHCLAKTFQQMTNHMTFAVIGALSKCLNS